MKQECRGAQVKWVSCFIMTLESNKGSQHQPTIDGEGEDALRIASLAKNRNAMQA